MFEEIDITGEQISNNIQNNSPSKQMYSFSKALRFPLRNPANISQFYNLPSVKSQRSASIGYGKKSDFTKGKNSNNNVPFYNIQRLFEYNDGSPNYSFGSILTSRVREKSPGPGKYNIIKPIGFNSPKFSLGNKLQKKFIKENYPGPGTYKNSLKLNLKGQYPLSQYKNTLMPGWSLSKSTRLYNYNNGVPAPNSYILGNLFNGTGKLYNSKFKSNPGKSMLSRHGDLYNINQNPGPGSYEVFSEFGIYRKKFHYIKKLIKSKSESNLFIGENSYLEKEEKESKNNFDNDINNKNNNISKNNDSKSNEGNEGKE